VQAIVKALIYLPQHISATSILAQQARAHIEYRGYRLLGFVHSWEDTLSLLRARTATVIVFARAEHFEASFEPRIEFVGEDTINLMERGAPRKPRNERHSEGDSRNRRPRPTN